MTTRGALQELLLWVGPARGFWTTAVNVPVELARQFTAGCSVTRAESSTSVNEARKVGGTRWHPELGWGERRQLADENTCLLTLRGGENTRTPQILGSASFVLLLFEQRKTYQFVNNGYFQRVWSEKPKSSSRELKIKDQIWKCKLLYVHTMES